MLFEKGFLLFQVAVSQELKAFLLAEARDEIVDLASKRVVAFRDSDGPGFLHKGGENGACGIWIFVGVVVDAELIVDESVGAALRDLHDTGTWVFEGDQLGVGQMACDPALTGGGGFCGEDAPWSVKVLDGLDVGFCADEKRESGEGVGVGEIDAASSFLGRGHRGQYEVDVSGLEGGDKAGEVHGHDFQFAPEVIGESFGDADADSVGGAGTVEHFEGRVAEIHADADDGWIFAACGFLPAGGEGEGREEGEEGKATARKHGDGA